MKLYRVYTGEKVIYKTAAEIEEDFRVLCARKIPPIVSKETIRKAARIYIYLVDDSIGPERVRFD